MPKRTVSIFLTFLITFTGLFSFQTSATYVSVGNFPIGVIFPPSYANTTMANYTKIKDMKANYVILDGNGIDNFTGNDAAITQANANGLKVFAGDVRLKSKDSYIDQLQANALRYVSSTNSLGQTFRMPNCFFGSFTLYADTSNWSSAVTITMKLYTSTAKTTLIGQYSITGPTTVNPCFLINTSVVAGNNYYFELTSNSASQVGIYCSTNNPYSEGTAYQAGTQNANDDLYFRGFINIGVYEENQKPSNATIDDITSHYGTNDTVAGYVVTDEPLANKFTRVGEVVDRLRSNSPSKSTLVNLLPSYYTDSGANGPYGLGQTQTTRALTSTNALGQTFVTNAVTRTIPTMQFYIESTTWAITETLTLKLWNSPSKNVLIAQGSLTGGGTNNYPQFTLSATVLPNTAYYCELTHDGGGDNSVNVYMASTEVDLERGGDAYVGGVKQGTDFWVTINQNINSNSYEDYVYRWAKQRPDFLMTDHYPWQTSGMSSTYFSDLEVVRRQSLSAEIPFWSYIQSFENSGLSQPTANQMRHQVYSNLAYGCKGINYFLYWTPGSSTMTNGIILADGTTNTTLYNAATTINTEVGNLGAILSTLTSDTVYHTGSSIPEGTTLLPADYFIKPSNASSSTIISTFKVINGKKYILIVNRDYSVSRTIAFNLSPKPSAITEVSKTTGQEVATNYSSSNGSFSSTFSAGEGKLFAIPYVLDNIAIKTSPVKSNYFAGEPFSLTGGEITANYTDGSSQDIYITPSMVSGFNTNSFGNQVITVEYGGKTASFNVFNSKYSIEGFDNSSSINEVYCDGNINVSFNSDVAYTKDSYLGSLRIIVPKGTVANWPKITLSNPNEVVPRLLDISSADKVSFWLYNNTANDTYVIVNDNVIVKVSPYSWKYSEYTKGTSDFYALFPDLQNAKFKFDIWNYDYDKYNGGNPVLYDRDIYLDELNITTRKSNEVESFDNSAVVSEVYNQGNIQSYFNSSPAYCKNGSLGSLRVIVPMGTTADWPKISLTNAGTTSTKLFDLSNDDKISFWSYNNTSNDTYIIFNANVIIRVPAKSWKYSEYIKGTSDFAALFPDVTKAEFNFDIWNYNYNEYNGSNTILYDRDLYIDEIYVGETLSLYSSNSTYQFVNTTKTIKNIPADRTFTQFRNELIASIGMISFKNLNGDLVTDEANTKVGTGFAVTVSDGDNMITYKTVIYGDVNGDGLIGITDLSYVKLHLLNSTKLENLNNASADVNKDTKVSISDLLLIKKHLLGIALIS
jgi:hypothetical protein